MILDKSWPSVSKRRTGRCWYNGANGEPSFSLLDDRIRKQPKDRLLYCERAHLRLYRGDTQLARSDFDATHRLRAEDFRTKRGRLHSDSEHNAIGVTYWIEGHRELAGSFWRYTTSLLAQGLVSYSHIGGGIEAGLMLWFGACHTGNELDTNLVRTLYEKRLQSTWWAHSLSPGPGPIVRFFLRQSKECELIEQASNEQELCEAHFAGAIRSREDKRYVGYRKHMQLAGPKVGPRAIDDYYNVFPYFLARHEATQ